MVQIAVIPGSNRKESFNRKLAACAVASLSSAGAQADFVDLRDFSLPLYDGDLEAEGMPPAVRDLRSRLRAADGIVLVSPEYNASVPPLLKNALDWVSRPDAGDPGASAFDGKPVLLMSASPGRLGGLRAQTVWRTSLINLGLWVSPDGVAVGAAHEAFAEDGSLKDKGVQKLMAEALTNLTHAAERLKG